MAHFAEIDDNNIVLRVLVTNNEDPGGDEGYSWLINTLGGKWIKTSYNGSIRKNFAGVGYYYDEEKDAFIAPKPYDSWILNEETCRWESSIKLPKTENIMYWNEELLSWEEFLDENGNPVKMPTPIIDPPSATPFEDLENNI